jgi:hypothetical protein
LINFLFNVTSIEKPKLINTSKIGNSYDTSLVEIKLKNKCFVNIFSTYNSAYCQKLFFLFDNGIIEQKDNIIKISGPSLIFDKKGFFKSPKILKKLKVNENKEYKDTLDESVSYFLTIARNKKKFNKKNWVTSIKSNDLIL